MSAHPPAAAKLSRCLPHVLGLDPGVGRRDHGSVNDHDRLPRPQLVNSAHRDLVTKPRAPQQPADAQLAGHARALDAVALSDHHDPVGVGETAPALAVGLAGKAAAATAVLAGPVRKLPTRVIQRDRTREAANPSSMRVVKSASADEEPQVLRGAVAPQRRHRPPSGLLA
jgi:hypothetical protein